MSTVSTMFTHAISCQNVKITYITQCSEPCNADKELTMRFGLTPNSFFSMHIFKKNKSIIHSSIMFYLKATLYLLRNAQSTDIVYTRNSTFIPYLFALKKLTRARVFLEAHGYHGNSESGKRTFILSRYNIAESLFLGRLNGICSITEAMNRLYKKDYPCLSVQTLPLGASVISQKIRIERSSGFASRQLCYIGRCNDNIDFRTVFRAISICKPFVIKLLWIGLTPSQIESLTELAKSHEIITQVIFLPWLGHNQMCSTIQKMAGAGLVSYNNTFDSNVQISPTKLFDFFSLGLPVICSDVGAVREIAGTEFNDFIYQPGNAEDLAFRIKKLFTSFDTYKQNCETSLKMADKFSWDHRAKRFISFVSNN